MTKLSEEQIAEKLKQLNGWRQENEKLVKEYKFEDFARAIMFVNDISPLMEEQKHHPDIDIRYNIVTLRLSTHSENGITDKDTRLANDIDKIEK